MYSLYKKTAGIPQNFFPQTFANTYILPIWTVVSGSTFTSGATDFKWDTLENVLWKFVPGKPAVTILVSDEVRNLAKQLIKFGILVDNRQKIVAKKHEKFFLKSKKSKKAKSLLLNK